MIFLNRVVVNGFKSSLRSVAVDFSSLQSSVIYGLNGCGKTTFLKILNAIFQQDESVLTEEEVKSVRIDYKYKDSSDDDWHDESIFLESNVVTIELDSFREKLTHSSLGKVFFEDNYERTEVKWNWEAYLDSRLANSRSLSLGVERGSPSVRLNINGKILAQYFSRVPELRRVFSASRLHEMSEDLALYMKSRSNSRPARLNVVNFSEPHVFLKEINMDNVESTLLDRYRVARRNSARKIQSALFDTLSSAISEARDYGPRKDTANYNETIYKNKELLIEALDDKTENSFKDSIVSKLREIKVLSDLESLSNNELLSRLLIEMSNQLKDSEQELFAINTVIDRFNEFVNGEKELIVNQSSVKIIIGDCEHSISQLSSGERHILTLFTLLLEQGRNRDFIIIDEPEISLNSLWQEALLPTIEEVLPNCQIIVASHSPILAESMDNLSELVVIDTELNDAN